MRRRKSSRRRRKSLGRRLKKSVRRIRKSSRRRRKKSSRRRRKKSSRRRRKKSSRRRRKKSSRRRRKKSSRRRRDLIVYRSKALPRKSGCNRRRIRRNKDGTLNKKDMAHNAKCYNENFLKDNPWMLEPWALKQVPHPEKIR